MEEVEELATSTDALLACSLCKRLLCEAVQLRCLHNCCRQCFSTAASTAGSEGISCVACGTVTQDGSEQPNGFVDGQVQRYRAIAESRVCGVCKGNGEPDKPALMWCASCRHSLCGDCIAGHRQYNRQHLTQSLEDLDSLDAVCTKPSPSMCAIHKKPLEVACRNCEQAKCISCWAECHEMKHETFVVGKESFDSYVSTFIASIASVERELLRKSEVLQKPKSLLLDIKAARDRHLDKISTRKRLVVDAVEMVYQEIAISTKNVYDDIEAEVHAADAVADRIDADLSDARNYIRRLVESDKKCEILNQQKAVRERLSALSAELDSLRERVALTKTEVKIEASLPDDVVDVVRAWIGMPRVHAASSSAAPSPPQLGTQQEQQQQAASSSPSQQQQQQSFSFGAASASFELPVQCRDVALTQDGRSLLLAARADGLIELSSANGRELSRWRPPKYVSSMDDSVQAVAALSDGRAAVSLCYAKLVVLLRRNETSNGSSNTRKKNATASGDDAWTEDRRLDLQLPYYQDCLSAHGDVLAASSGQQLHLLSLSSGRRLSGAVLQREYRIGSLAVAARAVVTGSYYKVELGGGRRAAHVLDAHSLDAGDERLWRHVLSSDSEQQEEELLGVFADSSGGSLYAAVCRSDKSSGRVIALSLADGSELQRVALSFSSAAAAASRQPLLLPVRLSLCHDRAAAEQQQSSSSSSCSGSGRVLLLAALRWDLATSEWKTVTLHRGTNDMRQ